MQTPDPEFAAEDENVVEFTDLDSPTGAGKTPNRFASWHKERSFRPRAWMSIAIIAGIALLLFTVLVNVLHLPKAARVTVQPVQFNYPVSLTVVDSVCYAIAPNGVVTAFRLTDGALIWRHVGKTQSTESATVVDGVIYLTPDLSIGSRTTTVTVDALRARDGSQLWFRTFSTDVPAFFQLTVVNKVVYVRSAVESIDALRSSDGSFLWRYSSHSSFVSLPTVANGIVYAGTIDGHLYALRASDGFPLWTYTALEPAQPLFPVVIDDLAYLSLQGGGMDVLRADTGVLLWQYKPQVPAQNLSSNILIALQDGSVEALRASSGSLLWHRTANS